MDRVAARGCCRRALSILGKAKGHDHPATAIALGRMRVIRKTQGKNVEAEIFHERELAIREQVDKAEPLELPIRAAPDAKQPNTPLSGERLWVCHISFASSCFADRDYDTALFHVVQAARLRPDVSETYHNVGIMLTVSGRHAEAVKAYAEAWRLQPDVPMMRFHLARALGNTQQFAESENHLRALLADDPDNPLYHTFLGVAVYRAGRRSEGMAEFRRALKLAPDLREANEVLAIAMGEAEQFVQQGMRHRDAGREAEAFTDLASALEIDPDHATALVVRGQMFMLRGNNEQSLADIERAIKAGTRQPEAFASRAHLRQEQASAEERPAATGTAPIPTSLRLMNWPLTSLSHWQIWRGPASTGVVSTRRSRPANRCWLGSRRIRSPCTTGEWCLPISAAGRSLSAICARPSGSIQSGPPTWMRSSPVSVSSRSHPVVRRTARGVERLQECRPTVVRLSARREKLVSEAIDGA